MCVNKHYLVVYNTLQHPTTSYDSTTFYLCCTTVVQRCTSLQHIPTTFLQHVVQQLYNSCTTVVQLLYDISTTLQHYNIITVHTLYRVRVRILTSRLLVKLFYISSLQLQPHVWNIITSTPESSSTVFIKRLAV
jgi:hypothetical protein